jgi:hypothetical protein
MNTKVPTTDLGAESLYDDFLASIDVSEKRRKDLSRRLLIELSRLKELHKTRLTIMDLTDHTNRAYRESYTPDEIEDAINVMKWQGTTTVAHGENTWTTTFIGDKLTEELLQAQ